jgi:2-dehydropantoate 2-reductase
MKILIVGAGGIGGYYGSKLMLAGADVTYLLREKRQAHIQKHGLVVETPQGSYTVHPKTITAQELRPGYDLIILAPKAFDLEDALGSISGASSQGFILPFLNGLAHIEQLDQRFGRERVIGGIAHIAATITGTGAVKQLTDLNVLTVGARTPNQEALAKEFYSLCQKTDFNAVYSDNIEQALWDKWTFLSTLAGMTTLCNGSIGEIVATPYGDALTKAMYAQCCAIAQAHGYAIAVAVQTKSIEMLTAVGSPMTASMLRDLNAGNKTEHAHILLEMIHKAQSKQLDCDLIKMAYTHIEVIQRRQSHHH